MSDYDERLREILRQGDPAAGDPELTTEEVRAMRRAVLSAVPEARRRGWLLPVFATAAALALAVALALSLWRTEGPEPGPQAPKIAAPVPSTPAPPPREIETAPKPAETPVRVAKRRERPHRERSIPSVPKPEPDTVVAQVEPSHQIQFSTPGGTRVIWVLNPSAE